MGKKFVLILFALIFIISISIIVAKPKMHKPFSISVIEYFVKINANGERETIKTVTTTNIKE